MDSGGGIQVELSPIAKEMLDAIKKKRERGLFGLVEL